MIPLVTVPTIYEVPLLLEEEGLGQQVMEKLGLPARGQDMAEWREFVERVKRPKEKVTIALVGKYVELQDSYLSVRESLCHSGIYHDRDVEITWVHSEDLEQSGDGAALRNVQGIVVPGGFGIRGIEGMIRAAAYARENRVPYLGLCLGMQVMVIEYARHVLGSPLPNSTEFDAATPYPVIDMMTGQRGVEDKGGTMRLGLYPCHLVAPSRAAAAYGVPLVKERHRHRFEFNNCFRQRFSEAGLVFSGVSPDESLVEICEVADHPWMVGVQFHPEFTSRPGHPHPLFRDFIAAAKGVMREGSQHRLPWEGMT